MYFVLAVFTIIGLSSADYIDLGCDPGWQAMGNGFCYLVVNSKAVSQANALTDCGNQNAMLLKIDSVAEMGNVTQMVKQFNSDGFWTSLTDLRLDGTKTQTGIWTWGGSYPLVNNTLTWESYPTSNPAETCGAINIQGMMTNWKCSQKFGFICEIEQTQDTGCPFGWMITDNACFLFSDYTDPTQKMTWSDAKAYCASRQLPDGITTPAKLVTMDSLNDSSYILGEMGSVGATDQFFWTGLIKSGQQWGWFNGDTYIPTYISWASEPDNINGKEDCAILKTDGKFSDQDCSKTFNYICRKQTQQDNTDFYLGCNGWIRANKLCYQFFDAPKKSWNDARATCRSMGADLLKVDDFDDRHWIEWQMTMNGHYSMYFTGLNDQAQEGTYRWADGSLYNASYVNWNQEPNSWSGNEDCSSITKDMVWNDNDCTLQRQFICEYSNLNAGACPTSTGWYTRPDNNECYYFSQINETKSWSEAEHYCHTLAFDKNQPTILLAVNDAEEQQWLSTIIPNLQSVRFGFWTGLNDINSEGIWTYPHKTDNPPNPLVITWKGEPMDVNGTKDCTWLGFGGRFLTVDCQQKIGYVCTKYASGISSSSATIYFHSSLFLLLSVVSFFIWKR